MSFHTETHVFNTVSGVGSATTDHKLRGLLWQILISPATPTTTWDMEIREEDTNVEILGWDTETGAVNSAFGLEVPLQARKYNLVILNSTVDEEFTFRITVREPVYAA